MRSCLIIDISPKINFSLLDKALGKDLPKERHMTLAITYGLYKTKVKYNREFR